jgi:hypothetical protein
VVRHLPGLKADDLRAVQVTAPAAIEHADLLIGELDRAFSKDTWTHRHEAKVRRDDRVTAGSRLPPRRRVLPMPAPLHLRLEPHRSRSFVRRALRLDPCCLARSPKGGPMVTG